jgi:hypothetical protein
MRKLFVGLLTVGLLAAAAPAMAQWGDPYNLLASGAVLPFVGSGAIDPGSISFLEVSAPGVGTGSNPPSSVHMFFFNSTCTRQGESVGLPVSGHILELLPLTPDFIGTTSPGDGLIALGGVDATGFHLVPLDGQLHAKVISFNVPNNQLRTWEPITVTNFESTFFGGGGAANGGALTWNPLMTGTAFFAPHLTGISTQLYFICPNTNIQSKSLTSIASAFPIASGFPIFETRFASLADFDGFQTAGTPTPLAVRIFRDDETFLRDATTSCNCLTKTDVTAISSVYTSAQAGPLGTLTEIQGGSATQTCSTSLTDVVPATASNPCACADEACATDPTHTSGFKFRLIQADHPSPFAFTGYRAMTFGSGASQASFFSRLQTGFACDFTPQSCFDR